MDAAGGNKSQLALEEEKILQFWKERDIFKKSEAKGDEEFVFYDGPPFANGLPHYGHILAGTIKDAVPRYQSMRGKRVRRRWGWDCHGLPVENLVEKELGLKTKKDIETYGIDKFNEAARVSIMKDVHDWKHIIPRLGRWADMENDYKTMDASYTESVWWSFKELDKKGLIEKGFKAMHLCPRCGTTLSNFEVNQGYKDITDIAVTVKLELTDQPGTHLLAWTTTPWTLPGNFAAAVNKDFEYVKVKIGDAHYVLAKERLSVLPPGYEVVETFPGSSLVGKSYKPIFDYFVEANLPNKERAWKVYAAPYVTLEDGTGIVHLAPAFGEEDLLLAKEEGIPIYHHVDQNGQFISEVKDFAGLQVKPKDDHQKTDIEVLKNLAARGLLFAKEKIVHSYPHCWRCDTPLLNYAATSWFVSVPKIKDQIISENKKIGWVPKSVGDYRFGNWLEGARDWAISRARFWGAPLPVWEAEDGERLIIGSKKELLEYAPKAKNRYVIMRHGEAENNVQNVVSSDPNNTHHLTEKGKAQTKAAAEQLRDMGINRIIASPFARTRETAEIVRAELGLSAETLIFDPALGELNTGVFSNGPVSAYHTFFANDEERFTKRPEGGETYADVKKRVGEVLYQCEQEYSEETILFVTHDAPGRMLFGASVGCTPRTVGELGTSCTIDFLNNAEVRELFFQPLPHNANFELDYHRPYIDAVVLERNGKRFKRVPEVFDCWYESGSMPYAQDHYPVRTEDFDPRTGKGYPADFIAEGLDQTRGWFYSLLVLGTALFGESPYRHVIVNGLVLAEDGQKMSKRLKNYPDPMEVVDQYGADALRYYLLSSPIVRGEDLNFSIRGVDEVVKKIIVRLKNVYAFLELYKDKETTTLASLLKLAQESSHTLDRWILARVRETGAEVTVGFDTYELDRATRPLALFVDDLSTWYLRRSRERLKAGGTDALHAAATLQLVLLELSKLMAPSMPFLAEWLYSGVRVAESAESVHLSDWPLLTAMLEDAALLAGMAELRRTVTLALELRAKAGIKVRQPLAELRVPDESLLAQTDVISILKDEVNVKEVRTSSGEEMWLDTTITDDLKREGDAREIIRFIQDTRKDMELMPEDRITVTVATDPLGQQLVETFRTDIERVVNGTISFGTQAEIPVPLPGYTLAVRIAKV